MAVKQFRDLRTWKMGKQIALAIYQVTAHFPEPERFGLTSQMRRAAVSIPSNVAEGFRRFSFPDFRRFLLMALGSCAELETQIDIAHDLGFIDAKRCEIILDQIDHEQKMITRMIQSRSNPRIPKSPER